MKSIHMTLMMLAAAFLACTPAQKKEATDVKDEMTELSQTIISDAHAEFDAMRQEAMDLKSNVEKEIAEIDNRLAKSSKNAEKELKERRAELVTIQSNLETKIAQLGKEISEDWNEIGAETREYFESVKESLKS